MYEGGAHLISLETLTIHQMDTGSGKTMIAVARIKAELELCSVDKVRDDARAELVLPYS